MKKGSKDNMTSLDFINLEIATVKKDYKQHINFGQTNFAIADEKRLKHLQQIKTELEAWEEIAPDLKEGKRIDISYLLKNDVDKFLKLKKALEVEENA